MTTVLSAVMLRAVSPDTQAALVVAAGGADPGRPPWPVELTGLTTVTFGVDLSADQQAAVLAVMTSRDDADMGRRQAVLDALAALNAMPGTNANGVAAAAPVLAKVNAIADVMNTLTEYVLGRI